MMNMLTLYKTPVKMYEEKDAVIGHAEEICSYGKKALIVTGKHSAKLCGALADVQDALASGGITSVLFDEIEENPSVETVMKARDMGLGEGCDFVIAIGGGSPMDAAKAIAIMIFHKEEDGTFLHRKGYPAAGDMRSESLPVIAVPTTCGTGSEVTAVSVLTRNDIGNKQSSTLKLFPALAFVDHKYLMHAPFDLIVNTSIDALGHMIESYINTGADEKTEETVRVGLTGWGKTKDVLVKKAELSEEVLCSLMHSSNIAGQAIAQSGTSLPHALSYRITYSFKVHHGRAIGLFQPGFLKAADKVKRENVLSWSGFRDIDEFEAFIRATVKPDELNMDAMRDTICMSVQDILHAPERIAKVPFPVDREVLERICFG